MPDGMPIGGRDAQLGGQAVLEGVMMRSASSWAVAVRTPAGEVEVTSEALVPWARRHRALRAPVIRGVVALVESMKIGLRALGISANAQLERGEDQPAIDDRTWGLTAALVLAVAIGLFFVLPAGVTLLVVGTHGSLWPFLLVEALLRTGIFVGYLAAINRSEGLRRTFEYHGAEHKTISCREAGDRLVPERAERYSRLHPRCGTSFLLVVMVLSTLVFAPVGLPGWHLLVLSRVLGIPVAVGISYEAIKLMGRHRRSRAARALMWPGLMLQNLTTREPDRDQLAVAIAALESVLEDEASGAEPDSDGIEIVA